MDTFVVRVYRSTQDPFAAEDPLRGVVDEVSTGVKATFHDAAELLTILRRDSPPDDDRGAG